MNNFGLWKGESPEATFLQRSLFSPKQSSLSGTGRQVTLDQVAKGLFLTRLCLDSSELSSQLGPDFWASLFILRCLLLARTTRLPQGNWVPHPSASSR